MDFLFYLSVLSSLHILNLQSVFIHGETPPIGNYWEIISQDPRVHYIFRARSGVIFTHDTYGITHEADVASADVIIQYGGMHVDVDLVFVRPLPPSFWRYDAIASPSQAVNDPYPVIINYGVFMSRPQSAFWRRVQESQKDYRGHDWNWNAARLLYKIYERNPAILNLNNYLQVQCWHRVCVPRWVSEKRSECVQWNRNVTSWMHEVFSWHFSDPTPPQLMSAETIRSGKGPWAEVGKVILKAAGLY